MVMKFTFLLSSLILVILDQLSKWAVTQYMIAPKIGVNTEAQNGVIPFFEWLAKPHDLYGFTSIEITPFFNIVMVWNKGISFGLFNDFGDIGPVILSSVAVLMSIAFAVWIIQTRSILHQCALALIIGGAIGNVIDRVRFGAVIDFLDVHAAGYHWPAFNLADSLIFIGVALLIIHMLFFEKDSEIENNSAKKSS